MKTIAAVRSCRASRAANACLFVLLSALGAPVGTEAAQGNAIISGRVINALTEEPLASVVVALDELKLETTAGGDGTFRFDNLPLGTYHVWVRAEGYSARRSEVAAVSSAEQPVDVRIDPELRFHDVVSVSAESRSQFDAYQPTSVLAGQELSKQLAMSVGATLESQPGLAARSFGPATSRPVVRGLDGDRVLILQDGQRTGDLSSQSADHAVTINPAAARTIEVVRGPATLLYGANAIGGLVNVLTDQIPSAPLSGVTGKMITDAGSGAKEAGTAAEIRAGNGTFAFQAGGGGRRSDDVSTPAGDIVNSQSRSGFGSVGLSWTGSKGYLGASYGYDDTTLGVPIVEDGMLQSTPRKHSVGVRAGVKDLTGAFEGFRATLSLRRYKHEELAGETVGTAFTNDTNEFELMGAHRAIGRMKGSVGAWILDRSFDAVGAEALSPAVDQRGGAAFAYEELTWPHVTFQFGGRLDTVRYSPVGEGERAFTTGSGSAGLLLRPAAANDALTVAVSVARAARYPAIEELFYFGAHPGNFAFEVGNPDIEPEHAFGFDVALRWRTARASGEVTIFRNDIGNYLFRRPLTEEEFEARESEFAGRFAGRGIAHDAGGGHGHGGFPFIEYVSSDSVLRGVEAHSDFQLTSQLSAEVGLDYVRGSLKDTNAALPRMPPLRVRGGLRYQHNAFQLGGDVTATAGQNRVYGTEAPTGGYELVKLFAAYSFASGPATHTVTARLDNLTNELYRNHLSLVKDLTPEMGRNVRLLYGVAF